MMYLIISSWYDNVSWIMFPQKDECSNTTNKYITLIPQREYPQTPIQLYPTPFHSCGQPNPLDTKPARVEKARNFAGESAFNEATLVMPCLHAFHMKSK